MSCSMSASQSQKYARRSRSGPGPDRSVANLLQQEIDKDPDLRGKDIRFRIDEPQGCLVVDLVVGQDTHKLAVGEFAVHTPQCVHRNACPRDGCDLLAQSVIDDEPAPGQAQLELSCFAIAPNQLDR